MRHSPALVWENKLALLATSLFGPHIETTQCCASVEVWIAWQKGFVCYEDSCKRKGSALLRRLSLVLPLGFFLYHGHLILMHAPTIIWFMTVCLSQMKSKSLNWVWMWSLWISYLSSCRAASVVGQTWTSHWRWHSKGWRAKTNGHRWVGASQPFLVSRKFTQNDSLSARKKRKSCPKVLGKSPTLNVCSELAGQAGTNSRESSTKNVQQACLKGSFCQGVLKVETQKVCETYRTSDYMVLFNHAVSFV